jgi:predicted aspartyl protease
MNARKRRDAWGAWGLEAPGDRASLTIHIAITSARLLSMKVLRVINITFLSALSLAGEGGSAGALTVSCAPAQTLGGGNRQAPGNEATSATVNHAGGAWSIRYVFANGSTISREQQYTIADESDFSYPHRWYGRLKQNPNPQMIGELAEVDGRFFYNERLYILSVHAPAGELVLRTSAECSRVGPSAAPAAVPAPSSPIGSLAPPIGGPSETVVQLLTGGGAFYVPDTINGQLTLKFVVDSGASDVSIPADVVMTLVRTETITDADFLGKETYTMADGSTVPSQRFVIRSLKVGDKTLENVVGSIAPVAGGLLLGQSFLSRFKSWSIDNQRQALILLQ